MKAGWLPKLLITPSALLVLVCVYGYIMFTVYLSFTASTILPSLEWSGSAAYSRLFGLDNWAISLKNLWVFATLYILLAIKKFEWKAASAPFFYTLWRYPSLSQVRLGNGC